MKSEKILSSNVEHKQLIDFAKLSAPYYRIVVSHCTN